MTKRFYFLIISTMIASLLMIQYVPTMQAQPSTSEETGQDGLSLDTTDAIYNANNSEFLGSKNLSSVPYLVTEEHYLEHGSLNNSVSVTDNETFVNKHISDKIRLGTGSGVMETADGQNITWVSSDLGFVDGDQWIFYAVKLFNSTDGESLAVLNNSFALSKSTSGLESPDYIWLLK